MSTKRFVHTLPRLSPTVWFASDFQEAFLHIMRTIPLLIVVSVELVSWCFKASQPQRIISGLRETFLKRYTVERTNKAAIRPEELVS